MALERRVSTAEAPEDHELGDMRRRLVVSALFTMPLFLLAMADVVPGDPIGHALGGRTLTFIELMLATPVVTWGASPFFQRALASLRTPNFNAFTLITLGTGAAYGYSVVAALAPGLSPQARRSEDARRPCTHVPRRVHRGCSSRAVSTR